MFVVKSLTRNIVLCLISYILGVLLFDLQIEISHGFVCLFLVIAVCIKCFVFKPKRKIVPILMCTFFVFGSFYAGAIYYHETNALSDKIGEKISVTGRITNVFDDENEFYDRYEIENSAVKSKNEETLYKKSKMIVSLKKYEQKSQCEKLKYGDIVEFKAELSEISKPLNEGEVNYRRLYRADRIFYSLEGEYDDVKYIDSKISYYNIYDISYIARSYFKKVIDLHFSSDSAALLKGMLLSEKDFSDSYYSLLTNSAMSHITVASGLHCGCVFAFICWICFALRLKKKWTYLTAMLFLWLFAFLQGLTASIIRAVIMMCFYMISDLAGRDYDKRHILFITAFIMLLVNPYMIFDVGFVLSFASVLGIALFYDIIYEKIVSVIYTPKFASLISVNLSVQILIVPLLAYYFKKVSLYSLMANILIVPVLSVTIILGFIFVATAGVHEVVAYTLSFVVDIFLKYINGVIYFSDKVPISKIDIFAVRLSWIIIYYLFLSPVYSYLTKGKKKFNYTGAALGASILVCVIALGIYQGSFMRVSFINVGQGDAALIKIPYSKTIVIDGGGSSPTSKTDIGESVFVPYLRANGASVIDYAVLSHYDKDHAQGIVAALRHLKVKNLILPYRENADNEEYKKIIEEIAGQKKINVLYFKEGDEIEIGGALLRAYAPTYQNAKNAYMSENEKSLVLKLSYGQTSFLFTGDIDEAAIGKLVKYDEQIDSDVIKASHHGSQDANPAKLIRTVSPSYAVISVGENTYNLPSKQVVNFMNRECIKVYRTDESGTVSFYADKKQIKWIDTFYNK